MIEIDRIETQFLATYREFPPFDGIANSRQIFVIAEKRRDNRCCNTRNFFDDACNDRQRINALAVVIIPVSREQDLWLYLSEPINDTIDAEIR